MDVRRIRPDEWLRIEADYWTECVEVRRAYGDGLEVATRAHQAEQDAKNIKVVA